ncbi:hypothetical protein Tco_1255774 [Tanacetum coccineum]
MGSNEETNAAGTDTRPPMLVESDYDSWKIRIHRYIRGKPNGKLIWKSIQNGPTPHPMITDPPPTILLLCPPPRKKLDSEFNEEENILEMADTQAEIILSQGLPRHIFNILNQTSTAKEIWDNVELLMQGSGRTLQQRKEDLFDEYERFRAIGNESIHDYFVRFHKLVNDMKITQLNIPTHQMNTKFVNNLPAYWGKYVTNVKQNMDISTTPYVKKLDSSQSYEPYAKDSPETGAVYIFHPQQPDSDSSNSRTHATVHDGHIVTEQFRGRLQCKEPKRKLDSQYFKDKALLMEAKEKGDVLDAETWMKGPNAVVAFMANLRCTRKEHFDSVLDEIDDNTIPVSSVSSWTRSPKMFSTEEKILSEKKELADSYIDEIVCLKNANKVARDMLQRFNMPTQTVHMLSKKPKAATADLHKDLLGTRNPGLGYIAKRAQPVLYDADTLLHPAHHPVSIWDSEDVLVHQVVSMKKMNEKPGHVRPANDFYDKLNALMFVPQKELSGDQVYWLSANEIASQASKPATPATPFVHKSPPPSQVLANLQKVNAVFHQFEEPDIEKKNLLIKNDCLIAACLEKDICSLVLTSDIVVPPSSNCLCEDLRSACDREHTKVLELEAEVLKQQKDASGKDDTSGNLDAQINIMKVLNVGSTVGSFDKQALETELTQLKDAITSVRIQNDGFKAENVNLKRHYEELSKSNAYSRSTFTTKINALTAENAKLKIELSGKKSSGSTAFEKPKVLASGMYTNSSKYIPPPKRANWVKPTPLPKNKQVTFQEPPRTSNRP